MAVTIYNDCNKEAEIFTFSLDAITADGATKSRAFDPDGVLGVSVAYIK